MILKKKRRMIRWAFVLSNFLLIMVIFISVFLLVQQLFPILRLADRIENQKFYAYNYEEVDQYYSEEEKRQTAYYYIDYTEIRNEYLPVVYLNETALEEGMPFLYQSMIQFYDFDFKNLPKNVLLTNDPSLVTEEIEYCPYFTDRQIRNYFFDLKIEVPYLCLVDEVPAITLAVYPDYPDASGEFWYNDIEESLLCMEGKALKSNFFRYNEFQMVIFIVLSVIPMIFVSVALGNFYSYYISKEQDDIIIQYIYYAPKKKLIWKYFKELMLLSGSSSVAAIVIAWSILLHNYGFLLGIGILCCLLVEGISVYLISRKYVKKSLNLNLWRQINV